MKNKIKNFAILITSGLLLAIVIWGFITLLINFSIQDGVITFLSVIVPNLIALVFLIFVFVRTLLIVQKKSKPSISENN
jgi:lipopolysaccharide export LptBFGC system permease protein LptF